MRIKTTQQRYCSVHSQNTRLWSGCFKSINILYLKSSVIILKNKYSNIYSIFLI